MWSPNLDIPTKYLGLNKDDVDYFIESLLDGHNKLLNKLIREIKVLEMRKESLQSELEETKKEQIIYKDEEDSIEPNRLLSDAHKRVEQTIILIDELANQKIEQIIEKATIQIEEFDATLNEIQEEIDDKKKRIENLLAQVISLLKTNIEDIHIGDEDDDDFNVIKNVNFKGNKRNDVIDIFPEKEAEEKPYAKIPKIVEEKVIKSLASYSDSKAEFIKYLDEILASGNSEKISGALFLVEINEFIVANYLFDSYSGDLLINEILRRIRGINNNLYVVRLSYDQIGIIYSDVDNIDTIEKMAKIISMQISKKIAIKDKKTELSSNIGISLYNNKSSKGEAVMNYAGIALYKSKDHGKNLYYLADEVLIDDLKFSNEMKLDLVEAIEKKTIELYYQPQYLSETKELVSFEALLRWTDERYGNIPITNIIKIAEKEALLDDMTDIIFKKACYFAKKVNSKGNNKNLVVYINFTPTQILKDGFIENIKKIIDEIGVLPRNLGFEITESCFMDSFKENVIKIEQIRDMGITISIDDFGTGYSSLSYLLKMPVSVIKIDKTFLDDLKTSEKCERFIESIISITHDLGLKVVAEGVEDSVQCDMLTQMKCDYLQGFYLAKPLPEEEAYMYV